MALFRSRQNIASNVSELEQRIEQRKNARRARRNRRILTVGIILLLFIFYMVTPLSRVKTPSVNGNVVLTKEEIITISALDERDFLFWANYENASKNLKDHPFIENVVIINDFLSCTILVKEIIFLGYSENTDGLKTYYLSDYSQKVEPLDSNDQAHLAKTPLLPMMDERFVVEQEDYEITLFGLSTLEPSVRQMITSISLYNNDTATLIVTLKDSTGVLVNIIIENEKIGTIFTPSRVSFILNEAKTQQQDCFRYGIDATNMKDILIKTNTCGS